MLFPLLVNLKLEEFSNSEELNTGTNKSLPPGVITEFFQGLLPIWTFRNLQVNFTGMEVVIISCSALSFIRTFITITSITVRVNNMTEEDQRQDKCCIPWSAKFIHVYICLHIHIYTYINLESCFKMKSVVLKILQLF